MKVYSIVSIFSGMVSIRWFRMNRDIRVVLLVWFEGKEYLFIERVINMFIWLWVGRRLRISVLITVIRSRFSSRAKSRFISISRSV